MIGQWYDANGNAGFNGTSYDGENRLTARTMTETSQNETYQYDPSGLRVARHYYYNGTAPDEVEIFTYDVAGRRILTSTCMVLNAGSNTCTLGKNYQRQTNQQEIYFAGRLVGSGGGAAFRDRLGSVRASGNLGWPVNYLPYGEERNTPPTEDGQMKFATYYRDSTIDSQDYANQRYYNPGFGRFYTPDPMKGGNAADPASWNKYAYTRGDPINRYDPSGLFDCPSGATCVTVTSDSPLIELQPIFPTTPGETYSGWGSATYFTDQINAALQHLIVTLPTPKSIIGGTLEQQNALTDGFRDALERLANPDCAGLFNPTGSFPDPVDTLQNTSYRILPIPGNNVGAETVNSSTVFVNSTGPFFDQDQFNATTGTFQHLDFGTGLTGAAWEALLLLHELGHQTGVFGADSGPPQSNAGQNVQNTQDVLNHCFTNLGGGMYQ